MHQMIRVLVAEDERVFLLNTVSKIEQADPDFCVIETAINGKDALEKTLQLKPDVIFTDVKMPVMDGLEFLRALRDRNIRTPVIMISGYSDFDFLRQAVTLSATDYLLKPLREDELAKLLKKLKLNLQGHLREQRRSVLSSQINRQSGSPPYSPSEHVPHFFVLLIEAGNLTTALLCAKNHAIYEALWAAIRWDEILGSLFRGKDWYLIDETLANQKVLLIEAEQGEACGNALLQGLLSRLSRASAPVAVHIASIDSAVTGDKLQDRVTELRNLLDERLVPCANELIEPGAGTKDTLVIPEQEVRAWLCTGSLSYFQQHLVELFAQWQKKSVPQRQLERALHGIFYILQSSSSNIYGSDISMVTKMTQESFSVCTEMASFYEKEVGLLNEYVLQKKNAAEYSQQIADRIIDYLQENYQNDISLQMIADAFHFTSAYLTKIFKKYVGDTPQHYLTGLRIQKAQQLIRQSPNLPAQVVGRMVGYEEPSYFYRVFKSTTGMTPADYRDQLKRNG